MEKREAKTGAREAKPAPVDADVQAYFDQTRDQRRKDHTEDIPTGVLHAMGKGLTHVGGLPSDTLAGRATIIGGHKDYPRTPGWKYKTYTMKSLSEPIT